MEEISLEEINGGAQRLKNRGAGDCACERSRNWCRCL